jgi:hypothetical protein
MISTGWRSVTWPALPYRFVADGRASWGAEAAHIVAQGRTGDPGSLGPGRLDGVDFLPACAAPAREDVDDGCHHGELVK